MMTLLKANIKNKEVRFLTKQILRDEIKKKINKKKQCKTKQIAIKEIRTKFNIKTNQN
jgi:DNA-binding transcriptional regulator YiaG